MPDNTFSYILAALFLGLWLLYAVRVTSKAIKSKYGPTKTVNAVVIDKHIIESFSKYAGNGKKEKYVVVFSVDGKKKAFYVSQLSYGGYRSNEKGKLTYKGERLISFE